MRNLEQEDLPKTTRAQLFYNAGRYDGFRGIRGGGDGTAFNTEWNRANYEDGYNSVPAEQVGSFVPKRDIKEGSMTSEVLKAQEGINGVKKHDGGKAPLMRGCIQRFPLALEQIARVSEYGQRKYGTYDGWEKLPDARARYQDAGGRHTVLEASEGVYDINDSGLPHAAQAAWNALATLELALRNGDIEMTDGNLIVDGKPVLGSNGRVNPA